MWNITSEAVRKRRIIIFAVAALAFAAKLLLALKTYGTNDVYTYERFGLWLRYFGADLYNIAPDLNHPPSMLHILSGILWMSEHTHLPFHFWLRFPGILADLASLWLICRILGNRIAERPVFIAVLLIAIAPIHILISGFHGNTDPVMIFFVMLAIWLAGYRDKPAAGGVVYGLALCIKIAPVILVPVLFLSLSGIRKRAVFFVSAATVIAIAWSPYFYQQPAAVIHQVFGYKSSYGLWGFSWLFRVLANAWPASGWINIGFSRVGSPLVVASVVALSVWMSRLEKKPSLYSQVGMVFLVFFTTTSGFAVQYLAWLTPWLAELGTLPVGMFMLTGSVFLLVVYNYWNLGMPWYMAIAYPWSSHQYFQVLCWISVLLLTWTAWHRIRYDRGLTFPSLRIPVAAQLAAAAVAIAVFLIYPAIVHMRHDWMGRQPTYDADEVLYTQADGYHNLASALWQRGRETEAYAVEDKAKKMDDQARQIADSLTRVQPARLVLRTPEDYVDTSQRDYDAGRFEQCIGNAKESLKLRPAMPAAWWNISICNAQLGDWDAAVAAATTALHIEPESIEVRQNLEWMIEQRRLAASAKR